jgi:hypothetical protein
MSSRLDDLRIEGVAKDVFIQKLSALHDVATRKASDQAKREGSEEQPAIVLSGSENG